MQDLNTNEFIAKLKGGNEAAFQTLHSRTARKLCDYVVKRFEVDIRDAEEIASDTLVKVHRSVAAFDSKRGAKLTTWIFTIAINTALDFLKRSPAKTREVCFDESVSRDIERESVQEMYRTANQAAQAAGLRESPMAWMSNTSASLQRIRRALESLSDKDQGVLRMRLIASYEEIAEIEGTSSGVIRTRHSRALSNLRAAYGREENHEYRK